MVIMPPGDAFATPCGAYARLKPGYNYRSCQHVLGAGRGRTHSITPLNGALLLRPAARTGGVQEVFLVRSLKVGSYLTNGSFLK
jgi:hypothetical protein